jgi:hypothetical protein
MKMSRTVPGNETEESRDALFRSRVQRFAGVEIAASFDTVPPRPELIHVAPDDSRLEKRVLRFVHRLAARA